MSFMYGIINGVDWTEETQHPKEPGVKTLNRVLGWGLIVDGICVFRVTGTFSKSKVLSYAAKENWRFKAELSDGSILMEQAHLEAIPR